MHSGQRGYTEIFVRPPRPKNNAGGAAITAAGAQGTGSGENGDEDDESLGWPGGGGGGEGAGDRGSGKSRSEAEEAWSCCGKTVVSAGRGCEPREPSATVRILFLSFKEENDDSTGETEVLSLLASTP